MCHIKFGCHVIGYGISLSKSKSDTLILEKNTHILSKPLETAKISLPVSQNLGAGNQSARNLALKALKAILAEIWISVRALNLHISDVEYLLTEKK